ncbi:hypothetical protein NSQ95_08430 [Psychrobacillus sp. FSL W7-1457]|uniref:hypothetical protein n=1 Tax=unclassified Psychrobacillus TaxID=2636677 RepID=UPI0026302D85|nr:hypothetical protein [uncultured Psychrobacillus sp.]
MKFMKRKRAFFHPGKAFLKVIVFITFFAAFLPTGITNTQMNDTFIGTTINTFQHSIDNLMVVSYEVNDTIIDENTGQAEYSVLTAYTLFGIPYAEVIATEESTYINKKYLFVR